MTSLYLHTDSLSEDPLDLGIEFDLFWAELVFFQGTSQQIELNGFPVQVADFLVLLHKIDIFPNPVFKIDGFPDQLLKINGFLGTQEPMLTRPLFSILVMNMII